MKKIILLISFLLFIPAFTQQSTCPAQTCSNNFFATAFTAGYIFKRDCNFKQVYGRGMIDVITADACYYFWHLLGAGAKVSYWRAKGHTIFLQQPTLMQEVPVTFYLRKMTDVDLLQAYISLGGGFAWLKEKNYLGCIRKYKGIGELEVGINFPLWCGINLTGAFRYLFPRQKVCCQKTDVGGFDLRAGIGFDF